MRPEFAFFIGAHHTVSRALASAFAGKRSQIEDGGTSLLLPVEFREFVKDAQILGSPSEKRLSKNKKISQVLAQLHTQLEAGNRDRRVAILEESFLGNVRGGLQQGILYPGLEKNLTALPRVLDNPWHTICLAIRPYDEFFAASYFRMVSKGVEIDVDRLRTNALKLQRTWLNVVDDIVDRLPNVQIKLWKASDTFLHRDAIETALLGGVFGAIPDRGRLEGKLRMKPSLVNKVDTVFWTQKQREHLRMHYEVHWDILVEQWPDILIR